MQSTAKERLVALFIKSRSI